MQVGLVVKAHRGLQKEMHLETLVNAYHVSKHRARRENEPNVKTILRCLDAKGDGSGRN